MLGILINCFSVFLTSNIMNEITLIGGILTLYTGLNIL
ncbi:hypothetical protein gpAD87_02610 [Paenibacillus sp. AD87]|nr:hypothetical protein gpAD87_02610 [Paenibacillus sp. AD87]